MSIERDKEIYTARVIEKRTLQSIADKYNLSRQRVYQIVSQQKELVDHTKDWKKPYRPDDGN